MVSFLNFKLQVIRLPQDTGVARQLTKTTIFIATPYEKTYLAVHSTKGCFFVNLLAGKLWV